MTSKKDIWREYLTILSLLWTWLSPIGKRFSDAQIYVYKHGRKFNISSKHCVVVWCSDNTAEAANVPSERYTHDTLPIHTQPYNGIPPSKSMWMKYFASMHSVYFTSLAVVVAYCCSCMCGLFRSNTLRLVYNSLHRLQVGTLYSIKTVPLRVRTRAHVLQLTCSKQQNFTFLFDCCFSHGFISIFTRYFFSFSRW